MIDAEIGTVTKDINLVGDVLCIGYEKIEKASFG